jgi:hypothetical protein
VKWPSISLKNSWQQVKSESTVKSSKKCGISNALEGNEDDILFQEHDTSSGYVFGKCRSLSVFLLALVCEVTGPATIKNTTTSTPVPGGK